MGRDAVSDSGAVVESVPRASPSAGFSLGGCRRESWTDTASSWPPASVALGSAGSANQQPPAAEPVVHNWETFPGFAQAQVDEANALATGGVLWTHSTLPKAAIFTLHWLGPVEPDGNCLFSALQKSLRTVETTLQLRKRAVRRFQEDYASGALPREATDIAVRNMYSPDISQGWGVNVVQEVKLLAKRDERPAMDTAIADLVSAGMTQELAAEDVYKDRCLRIEDGESWAKYMAIAGQPGDEHDIVTLMYTEEGLMTVDENREGKAAAFGDDFAIESLASDFARDIYVVQCHSPDAMVEESCLFFLPHKPRVPAGGSAIPFNPPVFLFMKGADWCAGGADHYEPLLARLRQEQSGKAAYVL